MYKSYSNVDMRAKSYALILCSDDKDAIKMKIIIMHEYFNSICAFWQWHAKIVCVCIALLYNYILAKVHQERVNQ